MNGFPKYTFDWASFTTNTTDLPHVSEDDDSWTKLAAEMAQTMNAEQQQRLEEIFGAPKKPPPAVEPEPLRFDHKRRIEL
jgi:hypothetical protein